jgi:hypothetical protein
VEVAMMWQMKVKTLAVYVDVEETDEPLCVVLTLTTTTRMMTTTTTTTMMMVLLVMRICWRQIHQEKHHVREVERHQHVENEEVTTTHQFDFDMVNQLAKVCSRDDNDNTVFLM